MPSLSTMIESVAAESETCSSVSFGLIKLKPPGLSLRVQDEIPSPDKPPLIASGAIAFATAMGAFGTAFTLATNIDVIPMVIYTEFTLSANIAMASALSIVLGVVTWILLLIARSLSGTTVAAGG